MVASVGGDIKCTLKFPSNAVEQVGETAVSKEFVLFFFIILHNVSLRPPCLY